MISQRTSGLNAVLALCQLLLTGALFWVEVLVVLVVYGAGVPSPHSYVVYCAVILLGLLLEMLGTKRFDSGTIHRDWLAAHRLSAHQTIFGAGLLLVYVVATKDGIISRVFTAGFIPSLYVLLFLTNRYLPRMLGQRFFAEERWEKTLLVGRVARAEALRPWLERKRDVGFRTVGILCDDDPWELEKCTYPRLGGAHEMVDIVRQYGVTQVIRTEMPATPDEQHFFVEACDQLGVRLLVVANLPERWGRPLTFIDDDGIRFIGLREEALENPFNQVIKRAIDLLGFAAGHPLRPPAAHFSGLALPAQTVSRPDLLPPRPRRSAKQGVQHSQIPHDAHRSPHGRASGHAERRPHLPRRSLVSQALH